MSMLIALKSACGMQLTDADLLELQRNMLWKARADLIQHEEDAEQQEAMVGMLRKRVARLRANIDLMEAGDEPLEFAATGGGGQDRVYTEVGVLADGSKLFR